MNLKKYLLLSLVLSPILSSASPAQVNCKDYTSLSTHAMLQCGDQELQRYDRQLNSAYKQLIHKLPPEERTRLKKAEKAWIAYRDLECNFEGFEMRDGSGEALLVQGCLVVQTKNRLKELRQILKDSFQD